jgi:hypothetical protein
MAKPNRANTCRKKNQHGKDIGLRTGQENDYGCDIAKAGDYAIYLGRVLTNPQTEVMLKLETPRDRVRSVNQIAIFIFASFDKIDGTIRTI